MDELQVVMKIAIVTKQGGKPQETDLILAALPLTMAAKGYVSRTMEVISVPDMPKELYNILSHTIPRLANYVTEITKNPAGNGEDIREIISNERDLGRAMAKVIGKSGKLDS